MPRTPGVLPAPRVLAARRLANTIVPRPHGVAVRIRDTVMIDAENALDAADHSADGRSDDGTDRPRDPTTFVESIYGSTGDALCLSHRRHREHHENCAYTRLQFHRLFLLLTLVASVERQRMAINEGRSVTDRWQQRHTSTE